MAFLLRYAVASKKPCKASALIVPIKNRVKRQPLSIARTFSSSLSYLDKQQEQQHEKQAQILQLKPWPKPCVECHGDYRDEVFLEQGPMYENQSKLPKLPIPTLKETMTRFLPTALPLAETPEEKETLLEACRNFPQEALELQKRLQKRLDECKEDSSSSWLQQWWNTLAYLQYRDPVVIYVSYFFQLDDDESLLNEKEHLGVKRAAAALRTAADFRNKVSSGTLPPDTIGRQATPLCMTPYKYMFHACRIPQLEQDSYKIYDPSQHTHAIVACRGRFYKIPLVDNKETGEPLPLAALEHALEQCLEKATTFENPDTTLELGWLTTSNRDDWARARTELLRLGGVAMEEALAELESGALLVCLDDEAAPANYQEGAEHFWYGAAANRWFDKSIQLICTQNGKLGYIGEHSMMDGMPAINLCQHLLGTTYQDYASQEGPAPESNVQVKDIFQDVWSGMADNDKDRIQNLVDTAKSEFETLSTDHEVTMLDYHGYGSNFIKKAGFPPDAYIQMAMQLATYRLFGTQVATYESVQVRPFLHGRTETARSVSPASHAFVKHMGLVPNEGGDHDPDIRNEKRAMLEAAAETHRDYCRDASKGLGVDRHLFGLSMLVQDGEDAPALFSHPLYDRSKHWRVTSSTVGVSVGFGEVVPNGVGIGYLVNPDSCNFTLTCRRENAWTERLSQLLEQALEEMHTIVDPESLPN